MPQPAGDYTRCIVSSNEYWVSLKLKPLWNWVRIEDDIFVHHLHLFPCITGIYKLSVRLIVIPCLNKSCIFHKHPNSDICIFVPIQIPITVIKAASDNSIFKTFNQQQEYALEVSVNYQMDKFVFHTVQYIHFSSIVIMMRCLYCWLLESQLWVWTN